VDVPVTLKMRLGWDEGSLNAPRDRGNGRGGGRADDHGPRPHPLSVLQGARRLGAIQAVKQAVSVPVIANGDIVDAPARGRRWRRRVPTG
jgi:tRNA-dihydrouridine synthase B